MVTRKRLQITGPQIAFITTTIRDWLPLFSDRKCAITVLDQLQETVKFNRISLTAYVLMPSHIHLLLGFPEIESMSSCIQQFKLRSSRRVKPHIPSQQSNQLYIGGKFRMWQPRFDDVIINSEDQFKTKIEYIHNNPVKAGLVKSAEEFDFSSARDWLSDKRGLIAINKEWNWVK